MLVADDLTLRLETLSACGVVRPGAADDAIDDVVPALVVAPESAEAVAAALATISRERLTTVIRGGGTKLGWGRTPRAVDVVLDLGRLNRVIAHRHGDLTVTVEAGAPLAAVNRQLARHRQWLPVDTAFDAATIGGLIATNDSGSLRHRYGTPRDLLIGIGLATTDGRLAKAGGQVVKNVAGYDLGRLVSGSFGSLAAIVSATFKLSPLPLAAATIAARFADRDAAVRAIAAVAASTLDPMAFDFDTSAPASGSEPMTVHLAVRFAASPRAVDAQIARVREMMSGADVSVSAGETDDELWRARRGELWTGSGAIVRMAWPAAATGDMLGTLETIARGEQTVITLTGRAGVGSGLARIGGDADAQVRVIARLRRQASAIQHVVVRRAGLDVKSRVDVWGPADAATPVLAAIKQALDPAGVMNAGRGPV
jgi:glycolate oxidase FAD binding subunit